VCCVGHDRRGLTIRPVPNRWYRRAFTRMLCAAGRPRAPPVPGGSMHGSLFSWPSFTAAARHRSDCGFGPDGVVAAQPGRRVWLPPGISVTLLPLRGDLRSTRGRERRSVRTAYPAAGPSRAPTLRDTQWTCVGAATLSSARPRVHVRESGVPNQVWRDGARPSIPSPPAVGARTHSKRRCIAAARSAARFWARPCGRWTPGPLLLGGRRDHCGPG
jgi:hypothetical protein